MNGQAADGVYVVFYLLGTGEEVSIPYTARTETAGMFTVKVQAPGEYTLTAFWPEVIQQEGEVIEGNDRFNGKYRLVNQPIMKVAIQEGENILPTINLTYP